jgi:outer membrane protein
MFLKTSLLFFLLSLTLQAHEYEPKYGWLIGMRAASVPYNISHPDDTMVSYLPLMWFEGDRLFFRDTCAGIHLYKNDFFEFNALARLRFVDMPRSDKEFFSGDIIDSDLNARLSYSNYLFNLSWLQDGYARHYGEAKVSYRYQSKHYNIQPFFQTQYRDSAFNSYYYGLGRTIAADFASAVGTDIKVDLSDNLQLYASLKTQYLGESVEKSPSIKNALNYEAIAGITVTNNTFKHTKSKLKPYLRVGYALATQGSFSEILTLNAESDPYNNKMLSLFYGYPISDHFLGFKIPLYLHSGLAYHMRSEVQDEALEGVSSFKIYFDLIANLRLGMATGFSYITQTTYIEKWANEKDGYDHTSQLMNYLDLSLDCAITEDIALGYSIHHRSGIFESVQSYGQIKGGSNYHTLYVQFKIPS